MKKHLYEPTLRMLFDPSDNLPVIELIRPISRHDWVGFHLIHQEGRRAGWLEGAYSPGRGRYFNDIRVDSPGRGIGKAAYLLAIEAAHKEGEPFCSTPGELTQYGANRWSKLIDMGIVEVIAPLTAHEFGVGQMSFFNFSGDLRIHPDLHT